jgi:hypothetical protein
MEAASASGFRVARLPVLPHGWNYTQVPDVGALRADPGIVGE